ncbi:single-stranded-DNA-specific exonuclease RecJ, partial [Arthrospira platensis SPKY1]|nr:single-stranded-DNA-specific exonuclease RecJ [Arthrospira platensis SPKY1]
SLFEASRRTAATAASSDLGFYVGPRINAAGRMEDMTLGIQGLLCEEDGRAREIAVALDAINRERKETQKQMEEEATQMLMHTEMDADARGLVLYKRQWHEGVIGLLASR